jgi:endo-1,4-beta-mannosidase
MRRRIVLLATALSAVILFASAAQNVQLPPPLATCTDDEAQAALAALEPYTPSRTNGFVRIADRQFTMGDTPYRVNYYPSRYPWRRFLTESDMVSVDDELMLMEGAGLNTLRIFLWNDALFQCPGSGAIPNPEAFHRLDAVIHLASAHHMRLIVTLNDMPDLEDYPLYDNPPYITTQTAFIVERYHDEAAVLAWDLRNEGDIDYGSNTVLPPKFSHEAVLNWLAQTSELVRGLDANHLITAGWLYDNESTIPFVDFVSFHHWVGAPEFRERLATLQATTDKPVLLEEFGYSTFRYTLDVQAQTIADVIQSAEADGAAGWLVWTAFDFPLSATCIRPACPSQDNGEHHFGLWYADYTPKPAVASLPR